MIETVNVTRDNDHEPRRKRRRTASSASGSSSLVGWDAPEASLDAYNDLDGGRLGANFSTLKKNKTDTDRDRRYLGEFPYQLPIAEPAPRNLEEDSRVPHWLSNTVSTLQSHHPLRGLIPAPPENPVQGQDEANDTSVVAFQLPVQMSQEAPHEEQVFAFCPPIASFDSVDDSTEHPFQPHPFQEPSTIFDDAFVPHDPIQSVASSSRYVHPNQFQLPSGTVERHSHAHAAAQFPPMSRQTATAVPPYIDTLAGDVEVGFAPFSAPGPLVHSGKAQNSTLRFAPSPAASVSTRIFSMDDPIVTLNDPLPFSKPGPLAPPPRIKDRPTSIASLRSQNSITPRFPNLLTPARPLTSTSDSSEHFSLSDLLRSDSTSSPTTNPPYPNTPYHGGLLRNSAALGAPHFPSAPSKDSLTTPGPTHIYFDSPTEDPQTSDPIDPTDYELDLDYENLDFRWEKFDPSGPPRADSKETSYFPLVSSNPDNDQDGESVKTSQHPLKLHLLSGPAPQTPPRINPLKRSTNDVRSGNQRRRHEEAPSPSGQAPSTTKIFAQSHGSSETNQKILSSSDKDEPFNSPPAHKSPATLEVAPGPAFAPASGIYISPLQSQVETVEGAGIVQGCDKNQSAEQDVKDRIRSGAVNGHKVWPLTVWTEARSHMPPV